MSVPISPALSAKDAELRASEGGDMTPLEILKQARELISVPERWTQGGSARDKDGLFVKSASAYAVCWCAAGAIYKTGYNDDASLTALRFLDAVSVSTIETFNDSHTHAEVLQAFDRAIAAAEPQP